MRLNISLFSTYSLQWCFENRLKIEKKQSSFRNKFIDMCINEILWHRMNCYSSLSPFCVLDLIKGAFLNTKKQKKNTKNIKYLSYNND